MKLTEEEALEKQCCVFPDKQCIGTDCMGWKWVYITHHESTGGIVPPRPRSVQTSKGYCGRS